jgi:hypothetical protein
MIARPPTTNNGSAHVIHRFHKVRSCVFHSIHRLRDVFGDSPPGISELRGGGALALDGSVSAAHAKTH